MTRLLLFADKVDESEEAEEERRSFAEAHLHRHGRLFPADVQTRGLLGVLQRVHSGVGADGPMEHDILRDLRAAQEVVLSRLCIHPTNRRHLLHLRILLLTLVITEVLS